MSHLGEGLPILFTVRLADSRPYPRLTSTRLSWSKSRGSKYLPNGAPSDLAKTQPIVWRPRFLDHRIDRGIVFVFTCLGLSRGSGKQGSLLSARRWEWGSPAASTHQGQHRPRKRPVCLCHVLRPAFPGQATPPQAFRSTKPNSRLIVIRTELHRRKPSLRPLPDDFCDR